MSERTIGELSAEKTPEVHSFREFADLIWNDMQKSDFRREKTVPQDRSMYMKRRDDPCPDRFGI